MKALILLLSISAFAEINLDLLLRSSFSDGEMSGGGGDVIVCRTPQGEIIDMQSYDLWKGPQEYTVTIDRDLETPYIEQVERTLSKIANYDLGFADYLRLHAEEFREENIPGPIVGLVDNLEDNGDANAIIIPNTHSDFCIQPNIQTRERIATFKIDPRPFEKPFLLKKELWLNATEDTKAGIVLHEIIYKRATQNYEENSVNTQRLNAIFNSNEFSSLGKVIYDYIVSDLEWYTRPIQTLHHNGIDFYINTFSIHEYDDIYQSYPNFSLDNYPQTISWPSSSGAPIDNGKIYLGKETVALRQSKFDINGNPIQGLIDSETSELQTIIGNTKLQQYSEFQYNYETETVTMGTISGGQKEGEDPTYTDRNWYIAYGGVGVRSKVHTSKIINYKGHELRIVGQASYLTQQGLPSVPPHSFREVYGRRGELIKTRFLVDFCYKNLDELKCGKMSYPATERYGFFEIMNE